MENQVRHPAAPVSVKRLTVLCLFGLAAGVAASVLVSAFQPPGAAVVLSTADALIRAWTNAFRLLVAPLVVAQLYLALAGGHSRLATAGRLGFSIPVTFAALLVFTAGLALLLTSTILKLPWFGAVSLPGVAAVTPAVTATAAVGSTWVDGFVPSNLIAVASTDNILPLMIFTLAFAIAMRGADGEAAATLLSFSRGVSHACFTLVGWLLRVTPVVMFALGYRAALTSGAAIGEVILGYVVLESVVLLAAIAMLYPIATLLAGVNLGRFARALWPAQLTAIGTRSSLATLPALLKGAESPLDLRPEASAAVLPIAGAVLKLSRAVSGPARILFLAHVLGISIGPGQLAIFAATILLLSTGTVGVPSVMSGNRSLPAYVAAGIPAEYVVLMNVVVSMTDVFRTVLNTSGYMTAAVLVDRFGVRLPASADASVPPEITPPLPATAR